MRVMEINYRKWRPASFCEHFDASFSFPALKIFAI